MYIHGGFLKDVPGRHKRMFPDTSIKRKVTIRITSWRGYSVGARHWYADIEEEFNYLWYSPEQAWKECWDDKRGKGRKYHKDCDTETEAVSWCRSMIPKHFKPSLHKLKYDTMGHNTLGKILDFEIERA